MDEAVRAMWEADKEMKMNKLNDELTMTITGDAARRLSKNAYWMNVAHAVGARATCPRRSVGAILVVNNHLVSGGYNGAPKGLGHCREAGCEMEHGHCVRAVHAEANCLLQAAEHGASTHGATLYTTASPCRACMSLIINAGVKHVVYSARYGNDNELDPKDAGAWSLEAADLVGVRMTHLKDETPEQTAAKAAIEAIYFNDGSDYVSALWDVVKALEPSAVEHLENSKLPPRLRTKEDS